jgi:HemY protein
MLKRVLIFVVFIALVGAVSSLVYFNVQDTEFRLTPDQAFTLPLGVLMLVATLAGALIMFIAALMREGRHALRDWRVHREMQSAERTAEHRALARSLLLAGDYKRARSLFTRATKRREPDVGDVIDYAETYIIEGDPTQARRILEDGQQDFGNEPLLLYALANACCAAGDDAAAISNLERALTVYPSSADILTLLRDLLFKTGAWRRAQEIQQRIVELKPEDEVERNRLLGARYEAARLATGEEREAALKNITTFDPDFAPAIVERARVLAAAGDDKRAVKSLEKAARRKPRAGVLEELERLTPAEQAGRLVKLYSKLVAAHPDNAALRLRAARYLISAGRIEGAAELLDGVSENGHGPALHALWAEVHSARSNPELAEASYRRALASSTSAARDSLRCQRCGVTTDVWRARCERCGSWGSLEAI